VTPGQGFYVDGRDVRWRPTDALGGPVLSDLGEVERLTDVIRTRGPVRGHFEPTQEAQ
jgi:hypothetical protein